MKKRKTNLSAKRKLKKQAGLPAIRKSKKQAGKKKIRIPLPKQSPKKISSEKIYNRKKEKNKVRKEK